MLSSAALFSSVQFSPRDCAPVDSLTKLIPLTRGLHARTHQDTLVCASVLTSPPRAMFITAAFAEGILSFPYCFRRSFPSASIGREARVEFTLGPIGVMLFRFSNSLSVGVRQSFFQCVCVCLCFYTVYSCCGILWPFVRVERYCL